MVVLAALLSIGFVQTSELAPYETPVRPEFFRPPTYGPSLSEISMRVRLGSTGLVELPVPNEFSGQTVVSFRVKTEPPAALQSWHLDKSANGLNTLLWATVASPGNEVVLTYEARIILPGFEVTRTQDKDYKPWLPASATVQSTDPAIISLSKSLQDPNQSRADYVNRVVKWVASNKVRQNLTPEAVDAKSAITSGGESLARANLCTALLRAAKIPARTVSHIPIWAGKSDAKFWHTEYWSDDNDWQMVDPTVGISHPVRNSMIELAIADGSDTSLKAETAIHLLRTYPRSTGARLMMGAYHRSKQVFDSAAKGKSEWYDDALFKSVVAKGPINLALFLDGKPMMPGR